MGDISCQEHTVRLNYSISSNTPLNVLSHSPGPRHCMHPFLSRSPVTLKILSPLLYAHSLSVPFCPLLFFSFPLPPIVILPAFHFTPFLSLSDTLWSPFHLQPLSLTPPVRQSHHTHPPPAHSSAPLSTLGHIWLRSVWQHCRWLTILNRFAFDRGIVQ